VSNDVPTPTIGEPLPQAAEAYAEPEKWQSWILAERGHRAEWARLFHVDLMDIEKDLGRHRRGGAQRPNPQDRGSWTGWSGLRRRHGVGDSVA
jgi:hypothetical protein